MEEGRKLFCCQKQLYQWSANTPWGLMLLELEEFHLLTIFCVLTAGFCWYGAISRGSIV